MLAALEERERKRGERERERKREREREEEEEEIFDYATCAKVKRCLIFLKLLKGLFLPPFLLFLWH